MSIYIFRFLLIVLLSGSQININICYIIDYHYISLQEVNNMAKKETTTITVWKDTVKELNKLKIHPRQIMGTHRRIS